MGLRKLERNTVKKSGSTNSFKERWNTYRTTKFGEGNVPRDNNKKKQRHLDDKDQFASALNWQKSMINAYKESQKVEKEEVAAE